MQTKQFEVHVKGIDTERGIVTKVISAFRTESDPPDHQGDRIFRGAFSRTIMRWKARMAEGTYLPVVYGHKDSPDMILGRALDLRESLDGFEVDEQYFLNKQAARDTYEAIQAGVLPKSSFAYDMIKGKRNADGGWDISELDVLEVGSTLYPADSATRVLAVKADTLDDSAWDKNKAMGACSSAADYRSICAGEKSDGTPDERQHWALPHHYLGRPANAAGVAAARARFDQTQGLTNEAAARRHLFETHRLPSDAKSEPPMDDDVVQAFGTALSSAFEKAIEAKVGREFSARNIATMQQVHDLMHELLKMPGHAGDEGKTDEPEEAKVDDPPVKAEVRAHLESVFADSAA